MAPDLTSEAWAQIRHAYEHTGRPVQDICLEHGTTPNTLRDRVRRWGWTPRRVPIPAEGPPPAPAPRIEHAPLSLPAAPQFDTTPPLAPAAPRIEAAGPCLAAPHAAPGENASAPDEPALIVPRLQSALARVLPAIEATLAKLAAGPVHPREMERAARVLSSLTRTLRELNALLSQYPVPAADDRGPEDHEAFIRELARRMDDFAALHTGGAAGGAEPEGA